MLLIPPDSQVRTSKADSAHLDWGSRASGLTLCCCYSVGTQQPISSQQSRQPSSHPDSHPAMSADPGQAPNQLSSTSRTGQGPGRRPGPFGDRIGPFGDRAGPERPSSPPPENSQQRAAELLQLRDALQSLPPSVADAISRHVSCTNEALQKAESERRAMARSLSAAHSQLATLPQLQV